MIICVYVGVYHSLDRSAVIRTYGRSELRVEDRVWGPGYGGYVSQPFAPPWSHLTLTHSPTPSFAKPASQAGQLLIH